MLALRQNARIHRHSAKLVKVDGRTELLYVAKEGNGFVLRHNGVGFSGEIASNWVWEAADLTATLNPIPAELDCVGLEMIKRRKLSDDIEIAHTMEMQNFAIVAMRSGEIIEVSIDTGQAIIIGEIVDDVPERSGILCFASTPDGSNIAIVSPAKITLMTSNWDVVVEVPLEETGMSASIFWRGEDRQGEEEVGKFFVVAIKTASGLVTSYIVSGDARVIKRADAQALQEEHGYLTGVMTWQPRVGGLICFMGPNRKLVFFERNGLRHLRSDFEIQPYGEDAANAEAHVRSLAWSTDCVNLAVVRREGGTFFADLYTHRNYKWYCRKRLLLNQEPAALLWDCLDVRLQVMHVLSVDGTLSILELQPCGSEITDVNRTLATVVDGKSVMVTDLSRALIPPPMCHDSVQLTSYVDEICHVPGRAGFGALLHDKRFACVHLPNDSASPTCKFSNGMAEQVWNIRCPDANAATSSYRFPFMLDHDILFLIRRQIGDDFDEVCAFKLVEGSSDALFCSSVAIDCSIVSISEKLSVSQEMLFVTDKGLLTRISVTPTGEIRTLRSEKGISNTLFVAAIEIKPFSSDGSTLTHAFVLCNSGHLLVADLERSSCFLLSTECSSFSILNQFLTFTTFNHVLYCVPLREEDIDDDSRPESEKPSEKSLLALIASTETTNMTKSEDNIVHSLIESFRAIRPIDRDSKIVATPVSDVRLILQAPRGNLETIAPRPVVRARVRELVRNGKYGEAFRLSRRQRIDMNEMVDVDFNAFIANVGKVIAQVQKPDHLSIFLTNIEGDASKINTICDAMAKELKIAGPEFIFPLLTACVRKEPSEFETALLHVWDVSEKGTSNSTSLLDYLFVLCKDDEKLYNCALGTYNLYLAVLVAKTSKQLDPAEYGHELRRLQKMDENEMRFSIDRKLNRNDSALRYLFKYEESLRMKVEGSNENANETSTVYKKSIEFALKHSLYPSALELFNFDEQVANRIRGEYGSYLMKKKEYGEAAKIYLSKNDFDRAAMALDLNGEWEKAIETIGRSDCDDESRLAFYDDVARGLQMRGNAKDAAHVRNVHLKDVDGALEVLIDAELWAEAIAICNVVADKRGMVESAVCEGGKKLAADIMDNAKKVGMRGERLHVVREMKRLISERLNENAQERAVGANSDVISVTSASTFKSNVSDLTFVGRSGTKSVQSTGSEFSSVSSRRKDVKAAERKAAKSKKKRVKEGSPHEEAYLVLNLKNLVPSKFLRDRVMRMLHALNTFSALNIAETVVCAMNELTAESLKLPEDCIDGDGVKEVLETKEWSAAIPGG